MSTRLKSYAKLNLYLKVRSLRRDNYHNIETLFERIDLCDEIILNPRRDNKIGVSSNVRDLPKMNGNLAYRAARLLREECGLKKGVDIRIVKRIPLGSGMGGGSSNAATVLLGLNKLWNLHLSQVKLANLAKKVGADVPFFIYRVPFALGSGRGEKIKVLKKLNSLRYWHVVVTPRIKVPTPRIYAGWDLHNKSQKAALTSIRDNAKMKPSALRKRELFSVTQALGNDLEPITCSLYSEVLKVRRELKGLGVKIVSMSGSGPTVFGVASSKKEAVGLYRKLSKEKKPWQVFVACTR